MSEDDLSLTETVHTMTLPELHALFDEGETWDRDCYIPTHSKIRRLAEQAFALDSSPNVLQLNAVVAAVHREIARRAVEAFRLGSSSSYAAGLAAGRRQGFQAGAYDFGTWKDGSVRIGVMERSIDEVMAIYDAPGFLPTQGWPES